jgi:predicted transposase YbfD/YdcC
VSAWAAANRLVLGQVAVDDKSNEITAIPLLLDMLDLHGATVTIDAMGCQTAIAEQIVGRGGNYVLALKANQPTMYADVAALFTDARAAQQAEYGMMMATSVHVAHGRTEIGRAFVISAPSAIAYLNERQGWAKLHSVVLIEAERTLGATTSTEQRYYLLNQVVDAPPANTLVRGHWGDREACALGVGCHLSGRYKPHSAGRCAAEYGRAAAHRAQAAPPGTKQGESQDQALSRGVGRDLSCHGTWNIRCDCPSTRARR